MTVWQTIRRRRSTRGSAAVMAAAIIVIAGFLGMALMSSLRVRGAASTSPVLAMQAYYIADAGTEWASMTDSETSDPITFASGSFEVTADGDAWVTVAGAADTNRTVDCEPIDIEAPLAAGFDYVTGSRKEKDDDAEFRIMNNTGSSIVFDSVKVTWGSPTAYFDKLKVNIETYHDYKEVWIYDQDAAGRWGSGETRSFTVTPSVTVPAHHTAKIKFENFWDSRTGGSPIDTDSAPMTIDFYNGGIPVHQVIVDVPPQP